LKAASEDLSSQVRRTHCGSGTLDPPGLGRGV
jgi:hypothetical protein